MQNAEKRKNPRRSIIYPAFVDLGDGSPPRECTLCDASQEGAQLAMADPNSLPNEFILALSSDGAARRRCRVIWRTENTVGVEFLKDSNKKGSRAKPQWAHAMRAIAPGSSQTSDQAPDKLDIDTLAPR